MVNIILNKGSYFDYLIIPNKIETHTVKVITIAIGQIHLHVHIYLRPKVFYTFQYLIYL